MRVKRNRSRLLAQLWTERQQDGSCLCVLEEGHCVNASKCRLKGHETKVLNDDG